MKVSYKMICGVLCCLLAVSNAGFAADSLVVKYPAVVLVQLRSEHNRITALKNKKLYRKLEEVEKDGKEVRNRMTLDFHDHFNYCPVYYYMDTNADKIQDQQFAGVLLHEDGSPVKKPAIAKGDSNYVIAYYGYPLAQGKLENVQRDTSKYTVREDDPNGKGLIIMNSKFLQVNYFYKLGMDEIFGPFRKKQYKPYKYQSKHFDIEYFPFASLFNEKLLERYGNHRRPNLPE